MSTDLIHRIDIVTPVETIYRVITTAAENSPRL
jgi:hypothetical protein